MATRVEHDLRTILVQLPAVASLVGGGTSLFTVTNIAVGQRRSIDTVVNFTAQTIVEFIATFIYEWTQGVYDGSNYTITVNGVAFADGDKVSNMDYDNDDWQDLLKLATTIVYSSPGTVLQVEDLTVSGTPTAGYALDASVASTASWMNTVRQILYALIYELQGSITTSRIRPDRFHKQDNYPGISIEVDDEDHLNGLDGKGGLVYSEVTVRCRAATRKAARQLAEAVRTNNTDPGTGLAGYDGNVNGHQFDAYLEDEQVSFTSKRAGSDQGWYDVFCNYICSFTETT